MANKQNKDKDKIFADKYYTPPTVAKWCIEKVKEIIGEENITEWVEPSAGCGMFSLQIPDCKAYDLYPQSEYIEKADFLKLDLGGYKKGRLFIGNPPFGGSSGKLVKDFYNKSCDDGDYIAYILPASYANNYSNFNRFEIIYSCIIKADYSGRDLFTSFVIYKRNPDKDKYTEEKIILQDITIKEYGRDNTGKKHKKVTPYDYCFTSFGGILTESKPYKTAVTIAVTCNNPENKTDIINCLRWLGKHQKETKFLNRRFTSNASISTSVIMRLLQICIPTIK